MTKQSKVNYIVSALLVIALIVCVVLDHCTIGVIAAIVAAVLIIGGTALSSALDNKLKNIEKAE